MICSYMHLKLPKASEFEKHEMNFSQKSTYLQGAHSEWIADGYRSKRNACNHSMACGYLTLSAGNGIGFEIWTASPVFWSICAYMVGHCKHDNEYFI